MNEGKLIKQLADGDTAALGRIVGTYTSYVRTVARNFSRGRLNNEDIDEVTADVFYKLWNARERLRAEAGLRSYLSVITRNTVKDRLRSAPPPAEDITEQELLSGFSVEDTAELNDMISCLYEALGQLSGDEQEIFYRFYFNGEKASRIAAAKGMTKAAVDMKLSRTRSKLRKYMTERGYDHV